MKNFTFVLGLALVFSLSLASSASAAMPNFIGTGYKQAASCVPSNDHLIWELVNSNMAVTGCITAEAFERSTAEAAARSATGLKFAVGTSVTLKTGAREFCPEWFPFTGGCIIAKSLVQ